VAGKRHCVILGTNHHRVGSSVASPYDVALQRPRWAGGPSQSSRALACPTYSAVRPKSGKQAAQLRNVTSPERKKTEVRNTTVVIKVMAVHYRSGFAIQGSFAAFGGIGDPHIDRSALDTQKSVAHGPRAGSISTWAMLIKRVYEVDPLACPCCGGQMKIVSFIERCQADVPVGCPSANPPPLRAVGRPAPHQRRSAGAAGPIAPRPARSAICRRSRIP
jgi:hypothetical protein